MGNSNGKPVILTDEVNLHHFRLLRVVGKGAFGKVRIVERKDTGLTFALKYIRKDEVVRSESVRNIIRERRMLEHLDHPFLCNLRYSFQDVEYLYIVVDLMNGGDLRFHISRKTFTEEAVRFWVAELGCALRYIHQQGIVHRDVKPDNVLLDSGGHVHLADFNVASDLSPHKPLTSRSGTLAYLAPEVYAGKGYGSEVDWWSLGVTFYECIYNKRPFESHHHEQLAQAIVKADVPFPVTSPAVSVACLHAISSLLERDRSRRLGAAGFDSFTDSPFFRPIDFEALERKEIPPVFYPSTEKTNFDATYDLEELLLEEAPLEARSRKQKPRAELREDATQQEIRADELHRMIETLFEPFNYTIVGQDRSPVSTSPVTTTTTGAAPTGSSTTIVGGTKAAVASSSMRRTSLHHRDAPTSADQAQIRARLKKPQSVPTPRSQTPGSQAGTRSSAHSPDGSPPLPAAALGEAFEPKREQQQLPQQGRQEYFPPAASEPQALPQPPQNQRARLIRYQEGAPAAHGPGAPSSDPTSVPANSRPAHRQRTGGGSQVVTPPLDPGAWTPPGQHGSPTASAATTPTDETHPARRLDFMGGHHAGIKPAGMLGFLNRKKGRDRSPKASKEKERESGVLGKEGARVVISHG